MPTVEIRVGGTLDGVEVRPETLPLRDLVAVLGYLDKAVRIEAGKAGKDRLGAEFLALSGVQAGSCSLRVAVGPQAAEAVGRITAALASRNFDGLRLEAQRRLHQGLGRLIRRGATVTVSADRTSPTFSASHPLPEITRPAEMRGETSVLALVRKAGNDNEPSAVVRLKQGPDPGGDLTIRVPADLCQKLGKHLFQEVMLHGTATWVVDGDDWLVRKLEVRDFTPLDGDPGGRPVEDIFADLAAAGGDVWVGVDPGEYVRELREDEEGAE